jgi:hypothetical protein
MNTHKKQKAPYLISSIPYRKKISIPYRKKTILIALEVSRNKA